MSTTTEEEAIRVEFFSLTLSDKNKETGSDKGTFRVYINDGFRVHEIYNPDMVNEFFTPLPEHLQKLSDDEDDEEEEEEEEEDEDEDEEEEDKEEEEEEEEEDGFQDGGHCTDLVLTGPNGDIVAWDYFDVIVHYNTGTRKTDDSHLKNFRSVYLKGKQANQFDVIQSWIGHGYSDFLNRLYPFRVWGPFGCIKLDFIAFEYSRLVTLDVMWFLKDSIVESSYICGKLSFHSSLYDEATSILLKTPEDKGIEVAHGESIRLLRSKVAIPVCKFFTVQASLKDPVTKAAVKGPVDFFFDQFSEKENYFVSQELDGRGAKIVVNVTMLPNDMKSLEGVGL